MAWTQHRNKIKINIIERILPVKILFILIFCTIRFDQPESTSIYYLPKKCKNNLEWFITYANMYREVMNLNLTAIDELQI